MKATLCLTLIMGWIGFIGFTQSPVSNFLNSLHQTQLDKALFQFTDDSRESWHFFPASMLEKRGIQLMELSPSQKDFFHIMLKSHLSQSGYQKAMKIIDLENILLELEGNANMRDSEKYYIAFYGNPKTDAIWGWSFEGHHLSLNFTSIGNHVSFAPRFMGASPATILHGKRKGQRVLALEDDLGLELINSLDSNQKNEAIFRKTNFREIVTFVESKAEPLETAGINAEALDQQQQKLLWKLIYEYISAMPEDLAKKRIEDVKKEQPNNIYFGWAGATSSRQPHYYRIQGKTFLIEFDNTQNNANHIHSVWRDFNGDFGRDLIQEHYKKSNHN
ncbi:DUF3500 domain-containing protein [Flagellimonas pacifica]|uniref:DUF3500 domain-containing protein n=1 Tax=Flagellimonas pacifica TaxID=1247520 RepID=A0A285MXG9_9FLAO|nr:DUF3500 domain-containing protein [Allomuricauda parva]SNZ00506.1 Protein of unknown function [Allomuricauda parva]